MNKLVVLITLVSSALANPSLIGAPLAYHGAALLGPSAVSHQSRVDVHSSPVLSHAHLAYSAPILHSPLALAPHQPATVLSPYGVPLDTIDVVAARAQHYQAKALASHGLHYLKKRSLYAANPLAYSSLLASAPLAYSSLLAPAPLAYSHSALVAPHSHLALAPHQPATVLSPHGVPLDTIDVVAARAQHYQAKALASHGLHYLKKRSLYAASPLAYSSLLAPAPLAYSHSGLVAPHSHLALARHQPATILSPYGVPLDTIDVVAARSAHLQAKALTAAHGVHLW